MISEEFCGNPFAYFNRSSEEFEKRSGNSEIGGLWGELLYTGGSFQRFLAVESDFCFAVLTSLMLVPG